LCSGIILDNLSEKQPDKGGQSSDVFVFLLKPENS